MQIALIRYTHGYTKRGRYRALTERHIPRVIQNGTPSYDLREKGGRKSATMVLWYTHLASAPVARHAAVVDGLLSVTSTTLGG